jgi:hypothetical protein
VFAANSLVGCLCFHDLPLECGVGLTKRAVLVLEPSEIVLHRARFVELPLVRALCAYAVCENLFASSLVCNLVDVIAQPSQSLHSRNVCSYGRISFFLWRCTCRIRSTIIFRGFGENFFCCRGFLRWGS